MTKIFWAVATMLLPFSLLAQLNIAVFDTAFCSTKLNHPDNVVIQKTQFSDGEYSIDCTKLTPTFQRKQRIFHGHFVLKELLANLKSKQKITLIPIVIYDRHQKQTFKTWSHGLHLAKKAGADILLSANGLVSIDSLYLALLPLNFIASGQVGGKIKRGTSIFPQNKKSEYGPRMILVGSYYPTTLGEEDLIKDPSMLNRKWIDFYTLPKIVPGSSGAVAKALGLALTHCYDSIIKSNGKKVRECLLAL